MKNRIIPSPLLSLKHSPLRFRKYSPLSSLSPLLFALLLAPLCAFAADDASSDGGKAPVDMKAVVSTLRERITLQGYAQFGYDHIGGPQTTGKGTDQFKVARAIVFATARVTDEVTARVMYDFKSSTLHEAWARWQPRKWAGIAVGQMKTPFSLENPLSPTVMETPYTASLVTGYMVSGASPVMMPGSAGRDLGAVCSGEALGGRLSYDVGVMNGEGRNKGDANPQKDLALRLSFKPCASLTLGASTLQGTGSLDPLSPVAQGLGGVKGNGNFKRQRYAAGFALKEGPLSLRSEYMAGREGASHSQGVYAALRMEDVALRNLDLVGLYDWLSTWEGRQQRLTAGVQYRFYPLCRVQLAYSHHHRSFAPLENALLMQIQVGF